MDRDQLLMVVAAVFAGLTALLVVAATAKQPFLLLVALPFAATTYLMWYHATGRLQERTRRRAGGTAAFEGSNAGRRSRDGRRTAGTGPRGRGPAGGSTRGRDASWRAPGAAGNGLTREEAYRTLGLDPGADGAAVKRAYRARVKEVHPDTETGDEESFKRVNRAYELLSE